jgi:hypothetical protein
LRGIAKDERLRSPTSKDEYEDHDKQRSTYTAQNDLEVALLIRVLDQGRGTPDETLFR